MVKNQTTNHFLNHIILPRKMQFRNNTMGKITDINYYLSIFKFFLSDLRAKLEVAIEKVLYSIRSSNIPSKYLNDATSDTDSEDYSQVNTKQYQFHNSLFSFNYI